MSELGKAITDHLKVALFGGVINSGFEAWIRAKVEEAIDKHKASRDPTTDERWNAGVDFAMTQLCSVLGVDPKAVSWDAATETVDGDVRAVIGNILLAKLGEEGEVGAVAETLDALKAWFGEASLTNQSRLYNASIRLFGDEQ
jgi:hypothetical protein